MCVDFIVVIKIHEIYHVRAKKSKTQNTIRPIPHTKNYDISVWVKTQLQRAFRHLKKESVALSECSGGA